MKQMGNKYILKIMKNPMKRTNISFVTSNYKKVLWNPKEKVCIYEKEICTLKCEKILISIFRMQC